MNCRKAQSLMPDYLYGELDSRRQEALKRHLQTCDACSNEMAAHENTIATFRQMQMEEAPADVTEKLTVMAAEDIKRGRSTPAALGWYWKPALVAAAVAVVIVVSVSRYMPLNAKRVQPSYSSIALKQNEKALDELQTREGSEARVSGKDIPSKPSDFVAAERAQPSREADSVLASRDDGAAPSYGNVVGAKSEQPLPNLEAEPAPGERQQLMLDENITEEYRNEKRGRADALAQAPPAMRAAPIPAGRVSAEPSPGAAAGASAGASAEAGARSTTETDSIKVAASSAKPEKNQLGDQKEAKEKADFMAQSGKLSPEPELKSRTAPDEFAIANAYFEIRDFRHAAMSYESFIARQPDDKRTADALFKLGRSHEELGRCEKAISVYSEIIDKHPDYRDMGDVLMATGECYLALGRTDDAKHTFEIVRDRFPALREAAEHKIEEAKERHIINPSE